MCRAKAIRDLPFFSTSVKTCSQCILYIICAIITKMLKLFQSCKLIMVKNPLKNSWIHIVTQISTQSKSVLTLLTICPPTFPKNRPTSCCTEKMTSLVFHTWLSFQKCTRLLLRAEEKKTTKKKTMVGNPRYLQTVWHVMYVHCGVFFK